MRIANQVYRFASRRSGSWLETVGTALADRLESGTHPLRLSIVDQTAGEVVLEATVVELTEDDRHAAAFQYLELLAPRRKAFQASPFGVVQIVPTGIRCEIGGFAGDAAPATNLLAGAAEFVVTHPNAVNASELNEMASNVFYVEGRALDDFLLGHLGLLPVRSNRVSTLIDAAGGELIDDVIHTINAARAVKGVDCGLYALSCRELGVRVEWSAAGCAVGTLRDPEALLEGVEALVAQGADAVGLVSVIHGVTKEMFAMHLRGEAPNPSGGVEAIITHLISKIFRIPTAHAPLPYYQQMKTRDTANPRAAAEFISTPHYFCVLKGLARAPRLVPLTTLETVPAHLLSLNQIGAIVVPASCLGGVPALAAEFSGIPLIAVRENRTILDLTNERMRMANVVEVDSYLEAAGVVVALRAGLSLESLRRPLRPALRLDLVARSSVAGAPAPPPVTSYPTGATSTAAGAASRTTP